MMLIDGVPATTVPATDRGLNYGDGLFETMRVHAGQVCLLERHLARLREGCRRIALPYPGDAALEADIARMYKLGSEPRFSAEPESGKPGPEPRFSSEKRGSDPGFVLRVTLTRGDGGRGYAPPAEAVGRRIVTLHPLPPAGPDSLAVGICRTRLGRSTALGGLKHLGRLEQVLAAAEVAAAGWDEGLMLDDQGRVVTATRHNLFYLRSGRMMTPPLVDCGVAGVMRGLVLETLAAAGMPGGEAPLRYDELHEVEGMFLCNAVAGVRSVCRLDGRPLDPARSVAALRAPLVKAGVAWLA